MLKRALEIVLAPLDWCWPLPLGIIFGALVVGASAGAWLIFREPPAPRQQPLRKNPPPAAQSPAHSEVAPPPPQPAPPAPAEPTVPAEAQPVETTKTIPAGTPSQSEPAAAIPQPGKTRLTSESKVPPTVSRPLTAQEAKLRDTLTRARWYMKHGQYRAAIEEFQAVLEMDPSDREARTGLQQARDASGNSGPSPQANRPTVSRPLVAQEAKLRDTLTRARWYMKQGQYRAAIEEFQAVLEMDPSNREARTGLQQARDASGNPKPSP